MSIQENIEAIRARMAQAAEAAGRDGGEILLVGASKMNDAAACRAAVAAGIDALGENRVQELLEKYGQGAYEGVPLHFIGHLQPNMDPRIIRKLGLIHSVSSLVRLARNDRQAEKHGLTQPVLLEVNIGREESKSGFLPEELFDAARAARDFSHVSVQGIMAIPPVEQEKHGNLPYFQEVARLYIDISRQLYHNGFKYLSMGMSDDFEDAIAAGANMVRVGSAIFGARNYQK